MARSEDIPSIKYPQNQDDWIDWTGAWWESMPSVPKSVMGESSGEAECLSGGKWIFTEPLVDVGQTATTENIAKQGSEFNSTVIYRINIVP